MKVFVAGASGTIGRAVVRTLVADGHEVIAQLRSDHPVIPDFDGSQPVILNPARARALAMALDEHRPQAVISCLASRSGAPRDARAVDYQANANLLAAAQGAGTEHLVLLSAICVQKPRLAFQHAKLKFERELAASGIEHTIVRPTAFFKSLSGQVERVLKGKPFLLFGDGELTRCKPISDNDLARFIADCLTMPQRRGAVLPIGGPGPAITLKQQGELLFEAAGKPPRFRSVPVGLFDAAAAILSLGEKWSDWFAEKAEYARIARYYATESMLVFDPETQQYSADDTPEFGSDTLLDHYRKLIAERRR